MPRRTASYRERHRPRLSWLASPLPKGALGPNAAGSARCLLPDEVPLPLVTLRTGDPEGSPITFNDRVLRDVGDMSLIAAPATVMNF